MGHIQNKRRNFSFMMSRDHPLCLILYLRQQYNYLFDSDTLLSATVPVPSILLLSLSILAIQLSVWFRYLVICYCSSTLYSTPVFILLHQLVSMITSTNRPGSARSGGFRLIGNKFKTSKKCYRFGISLNR